MKLPGCCPHCGSTDAAEIRQRGAVLLYVELFGGEREFIEYEIESPAPTMARCCSCSRLFKMLEGEPPPVMPR